MTFEMENFRAQLEAANCPCVEQIDDSELDAWLFRPGSDRIQLLQWCLGQLDPELQKHFQNIPDNRVEKEIVQLMNSFGVCKATDDDIVLGRSTWQKQSIMWQRLFKLLGVAQKSGGSSEDIRPQYIANFSMLLGMVKSRDFWELMATPIKLIPVELHLPPISQSLEHFQNELVSAQNELKDFRERSVTDHIETNISISGDLHESHEDFTENLKKIQECYQHLAKGVLPAVKRRPENPSAQIFGLLVEAVSDKLTALVQMLKNREDIKKMADSLLSSKRLAESPTSNSELQEYLSKTYSLLSDILVLMRSHDMIKD